MMEALLSKTRSLNLLAKGFGALNSNQKRGYNVSKYVTLTKRIARNRKNGTSLNWTKALFDGLERLKSLDLSEPQMLHVVSLRATTRGRPWWEKQIIQELGLEGKLNQPVILKNISGINQMLNEVKHLLVIQPLKLPNGLPNHPKEIETLTLKSNGELVFEKQSECQDSNEKGEQSRDEAQGSDVEESSGKLGPEWTFQRETLQKKLDRTLQLYQVNLEQFDTKYEYKRNQDGKMYRYTFNKDVRKYLL